MQKLSLTSFSLILLSTVVLAQNEQAVIKNIRSHEALPITRPARPAQGKTYADPTFGTTIQRITDAKKLGLQGCFPQYSKRQAWNTDESLLLLFSDDGSTRLYDGSNYGFMKILDGVGGEDVFWHPLQRSLVIYTDENKICSYDVLKDEKKVIASFPEYSFVNTRGEGNLSTDGSTYAFVGQVYNEKSGDVIFKKLVLYDLKQNKNISSLELPGGIEDFDWVSVSPGGDFVVVDYADNEQKHFHGVEVYDRSFHLLWQKGLGSGHSDLGLDEKGEEVLIMDCYDETENLTNIKKYRLRDGAETTLLGISPYFDQHISCRNEAQKGWCFISTFNYTGRLTEGENGVLPFENEIFALKMDGSKEVRRLALHHSVRYSVQTPDSDHSVYWAEPHATVSRKANRILWGSNWGENVQQVMSVDVYVGSFNLDK